MGLGGARGGGGRGRVRWVSRAGAAPGRREWRGRGDEAASGRAPGWGLGWSGCLGGGHARL